MRITLVQKKTVLGDKDSNLEIIKNTIKNNNSDIYIFPELFLTGYNLKDMLWEKAETIPGPSSKMLSELAKDENTSIICGLPEKVKRSGRLKNSALYIDPKGNVNVYRKTYLPNFGPFDEMRYFEPDNDMPIFETPFGKLGIVICYDIFFPELTKSLALKGADFITCISASPSISREYFEKIITARAMETTAFVFYANLIGREENLTFWGGDEVVSPKGNQLAKGPYYEEDLLNVELDLEDITKARKSRPVLNDTRTEMMYESADSSFKE